LRTRDLKPGFFRNEALSELPALTRLLYQGLWLMADREGRLLDSIKVIEAEVFPYEKVNVERGLTQLAAGDDPFIVRYQAQGKRCIWLPKFLANQRPHPHEVASQLPPCPDAAVTLPLQGNDLSQPISRPDPPHSLTLSQSSDLATSTSSTLGAAPPSDRAVAATTRATRDRLKAKYPIVSDDWTSLIDQFGSSVNARYWEWLDWIGEREEERAPKDPYRAFKGFLDKPGHTLRELQEPYGNHGAIQGSAAAAR